MAVDPHFALPAAESVIDRILEAQRQRRRAAPPPSVDERIARIRKLEAALLARRSEFHKALWDDYRKPSAEVDLSEIYPVLGEARHARRHLRRWARPHSVRTPLALLGSRSHLIYEPKGVVLIISPWNFPVNLTLGPLVSAIAAGNSVIIKPSEMTPHASALMKAVLADLFDESEVAVVEGDGAVAQALLAKRFDHIFFTGSPAVGRLVMKAAAEHLTSVTLELGGKSPTIVDRTADLDEAAKKIAWGKYFNSGQICIAPDYLLVDETVSASFVEKLGRAIESLGGEASRSALVNDRHAARVRKLIDDAAAGGAKIMTRGQAAGNYIPPTVIEGAGPESEVMRQEIFGPVLPIVTYRTIEDAMATIASKEKPLVLYVFSRSRQFVDRVLANTTSGGAVVNDTLLNFYQLNLPFGGVGESGVGKGHGFFGFEAFSNVRGVLGQPMKFSGIQLMYPPYTWFKQKLIDLMLRFL